jgi:putative transposase
VLANSEAHSILIEVWSNAEELYGWRVGSYTIMPDHVHFFCAAGRSTHSLSQFVGKWKEWTAKYLHRRHGCQPSVWQVRFFDHLLRNDESYQSKWRYERENPVRAGLVSSKGRPMGAVEHGVTL